MFYKLPLAESLEHVTSGDELAQYRQLRRGGLLGAFSGSAFFGAPELTGLNRILWHRAREHLINGHWDADAFEGDNPTIQKRLHRDMWRLIEPNRAFTRVYGGGFDFVGVLVSGAVSSLVGGCEQEVASNADNGAQVAIEEDLKDGGPWSRARLQGQIKALFKRLDEELPLYECKPTFFARAQEEFGPGLSEYILLQAWGNAEVNPERRKPGLRKLID